MAGKINAKGEPFTKTTTLPSKRCCTALSGRSVEIALGKPNELSSLINCSN